MSGSMHAAADSSHPESGNSEAGGTVEQALIGLSADSASGGLRVRSAQAEESWVWLADGAVCGVSVPGRRPLLGIRLLSSGQISPEDLARALGAQRTTHAGQRIGQVLVALGLVDHQMVTTFVEEQVRDQVADLLSFTEVEFEFHPESRPTTEPMRAVAVDVLVAEARARRRTWVEVLREVGGPEAVPTLATQGDLAAEVILGANDWSMLCKVDGERTLADLSHQCGFSVLETGQVLLNLRNAGLIEIEGSNIVLAEDEPEPVAVPEEAVAPADEPVEAAEENEHLAEVVPLYPNAVVSDVSADEPAVIPAALVPDELDAGFDVEPDAGFHVEPDAGFAPVAAAMDLAPDASPDAGPASLNISEDIAAIFSSLADAPAPAVESLDDAYALEPVTDTDDILRTLGVVAETSSPGGSRPAFSMEMHSTPRPDSATDGPDPVKPSSGLAQPDRVAKPAQPDRVAQPAQPDRVTQPARVEQPIETSQPAEEVPAAAAHEPAPSPVQAPDPAPATPRSQAPAPADTTSLLRELSSLGAQTPEESGQQVARHAVTRQNPEPKKRKRLFGL